MNKALVVDYKYCDGCNSCIIACKNEKGFMGDEWGIKIEEIGPEKIDEKMFWHYMPYLSDRCDLCESRVLEGKQPSCVHHCLGKCMELVEIENLSTKVAALGKTVVVLIP